MMRVQSSSGEETAAGCTGLAPLGEGWGGVILESLLETHGVGVAHSDERFVWLDVCFVPIRPF